MEIIKWEVDGPALTLTPKGKTSAVSQKSTSKGGEGIEEGGVSEPPPTAQGTLHPDAPPSGEKSINEAPKSSLHSKAMEETSSKSCVWFKIKLKLKKFYVPCISIDICTVCYFPTITFVKDIGLIWGFTLPLLTLKILYIYIYTFHDLFHPFENKRTAHHKK